MKTSCHVLYCLARQSLWRWREGLIAQFNNMRCYQPLPPGGKNKPGRSKAKTGFATELIVTTYKKT
jgi:hypothetical protein